MRFLPDGPNIPDELLEARDNGKVVFFCGAGTSRAANLPGFLGLAKLVVEELGTPHDAKSQKLLCRAENDSDFSPALDQVFNLLQREYGVGRIEDVVSRLLRTPRSANTERHSLILRLSRGASDIPQIVTTNFDTLFERADRRLLKHIPPALPDIASGQALQGIVYLHGRRASGTTNGLTSLGLVLSSADFGRAYLADGWATRFVRDLLTSYVIVLLGYSATDPPIRYLLEGLHSRADGKSSNIYAFDQGERPEVVDRWRDRGVIPLPYPVSDPHHSALWDSLRLWAARADNLIAWQYSVTAIAQQNPKTLRPYQRGQVASLVRTPIGAKIFADANPLPPAEWICVLDRFLRLAEPRKDFVSQQIFDPLIHYGLDDDPPRPQKRDNRDTLEGDDFVSLLSSDAVKDGKVRLTGISPRWASPLPARLFHFSRWLGSVATDPTILWWIAGYNAVHPTLLEQLEWHLDKVAPIENDLRHVWALLFEKFRYSPDDHGALKWYSFARQLRKDGWSAKLLREFQRVAKPYLVSTRPSGTAPFPPAINLTSFRVQDFVALDVKFQIRDPEKLAIPTEWLPYVFRVLRNALERGSDLLNEIGTTYWKTATFYPDVASGNRHVDDVDRLLHWVASLLDRLCAEHISFARAEVRRWPDNDRFFFNKLRLYAWTKSSLFSGLEVASGLLSIPDDEFWNSYYRRDLLHLLRSRWRDTSERMRRRIELRFLNGPQKWKDETDEDYHKRRDILAAMIFGWLDRQQCNLSKRVLRLLPKLRLADSRWQPSWDESIDESFDIRSGWVRVETDPSKIMDAPISELIDRAARFSERSAHDFSRSEPFRGVVAMRPFRAVAALSFQARKGNFPVSFWRTAISHWPADATERQRWLFAHRIARLPSDVVFELRFDVPYWFNKNLPTLASASLSSLLALWDRIVDHLFSVGSESTTSSLHDLETLNEDDMRSRRTRDHALNSPIGRMTDTLLKILSKQGRKKRTGIPIDFKRRLEKLLNSPGEGKDHATCEIASEIRWLDFLDPVWARKRIVPLFAIGDDSAEPAWSGYLATTELPRSELFSLIKPHFLNAFKVAPSWRWRDSSIDRLYEFLVVACYWSLKDKRYISFEEARIALRQIDDEARAHVAWYLGHLIKEQRCWKAFGKRFLQAAWPLETRFQTQRVSAQLAGLTDDCGNHFPDVVRTIAPLLKPVEHLDLVIHGLNDTEDQQAGHPGAKFPEATLALLDKLVPKDFRVVPYGLRSVLDLIADTAPRFRQDRRWRRLDALL